MIGKGNEWLFKVKYTDLDLMQNLFWGKETFL